ncbi:MAG: hypothetical protein ABL959_06525 [Pyrinomonadaceae bacterium]
MDLSTAKQIKSRALAAIAELDAVVSDTREQCSPEDVQQIRRRVGHLIGYIVTDLLEPILQRFPEIDDLKE